jgi:hypothetical protein
MFELPSSNPMEESNFVRNCALEGIYGKTILRKMVEEKIVLISSRLEYILKYVRFCNDYKKKAFSTKKNVHYILSDKTRIEFCENVKKHYLNGIYFGLAYDVFYKKSENAKIYSSYMKKYLRLIENTGGYTERSALILPEIFEKERRSHYKSLSLSRFFCKIKNKIKSAFKQKAK